MSAHIKTWQERRNEAVGKNNAYLHSADPYKDAEIADLRAALQAQQGVERQAYDALARERDEYKRRAEAAEQAQQGDALDAKRWRGLRDLHNNGDTQWFIYGAPTFITDGDVDAALAARREG